VLKKTRAIFERIIGVSIHVLSLISLDLPPLGHGNNLIGWPTFKPKPFSNHDIRALNPILVQNFNFFEKAELNLEFNETSAIGFLTQSFA